MDAQVPLGKRETEVLEFKAAAALRNPFSISREVVAMLNASGGEVWIGLRDVEGRAAAAEGIPDVDRARVDLLNHLIEVVEPRLHIPGDVAIEPVDCDGRDLLCLVMPPPRGRGPFAQLKDGGRHFVLRVDHRIRPMTREEIFERSAPALNEPRSEFLSNLRTKILEIDRPGLWVGIGPEPSLHVDVQSPALEGLLRDPEKSGNRATGWSFSYPAGFGIEPRLGDGRIEFGRDDSRWTRVWDNGCVEFWTGMEGLHHRTDSEQEIHPLALLEYPVSIARLAAALFGDGEIAQSPPGEVFVDTVLIRAERWQLPAYPTETYGHVSEHETPEQLDGGRFVLPSPHRFSWQDFRRTPDHPGYMLVRSIYQAFHLREDRIPHQYDRESSRLVLPN